MQAQTLPAALVENTFWIGSAHPFDLHEVYLCFRRTFRIEHLPDNAELYITADSRYKLWINGQFVLRGPARGYPHMQPVDRIDLMPHLHGGLNCLAIQVYQPGYSHFSYVHRGAAGVWACLIFDGERVLATDTSWRTRRDLSFNSLVPRVSIYGSGVEEHDMNLEENWAGLTYDDSHWLPARLVAPTFGYPWTSLALRALPLLAEREASFKLVKTRRGAFPTAVESDPHLALREGWYNAQPFVLEADGEGWFTPRLELNQAAYWLYDLGRDYACQGYAEIEGADGEECLSVSYAEKIRKGQLILSDPETYCRVRLTDRFRLRPGSQLGESFSLRGGRYLVFQLNGPAGADFRIRFHARVAEYPLQVDNQLPVADAALGAIVTLCEETFRACLLDGFIDSTWRENSQWVGDALPQALIMSAMSEDTRPLRRVIEMAVQGAYSDGVLPSVVPSEAHSYTVVDYNLTWVELLALFWQRTDDREFVETMWQPLVHMLERLNSDVDREGMIWSQPGRRLFLDWAPVSRGEPNAIYNLHYALALQLAARLAKDTHHEGDAARWQARAEAAQVASRAAFCHEGRWYDDRERTTLSQLAASFALLARATCPDEEIALLDAIAARSLDPDDTFDPQRMVLASPFMHHYVFEALRRGGKFREVVEIIRLRWGRWVEAGFPTAWENWNVDFPDGSQCHAFSAHPRYHLAEIARASGSL